jgi:hypothetical protein
MLVVTYVDATTGFRLVITRGVIPRWTTNHCGVKKSLVTVVGRDCET